MVPSASTSKISQKYRIVEAIHAECESDGHSYSRIASKLIPEGWNEQRRLVYCMESIYIHNPSAIDVWMKDRTQTVYRIRAGGTIRFSVSESL